MTITLFKLCCAALLCYVLLFDCRLSDVKREHLRAERFAGKRYDRLALFGFRFYPESPLTAYHSHVFRSYYVV